jgi:glycosyltransferase involved in cell wall biosynthesis
MKALVIIPAYNESRSIVDVVKSVEAAGYDYIVINDGSKDATIDICRTHNINVLDLGDNLGIGGAVQAGHRYALQNGYDVDVQFDGDGQHDAAYIATLLKGIESGANLVIGSRFIEKSDGFQSSPMRRLGIKWLSAMIKLTCGIKIFDSTSGFRACDVRAIYLYSKNYPVDYPEPESIVSAAKHELKVLEVPVVMHERRAGHSSIRALSSIYYMIKVTLAILISRSPSKEELSESRRRHA